MGVDRSLPEIARAAEFTFSFQARNGEFYQCWRARGGPPSPLAPVPCVTARAATYLAQVGYATDPRIGLAAGYLLSTQRADGSWSCEARAIPRGYASERGCLGMTCDFLALAAEVPSLRLPPVRVRPRHGRTSPGRIPRFWRESGGRCPGRPGHAPARRGAFPCAT